MYKLKKVYICDHCGKVALSEHHRIGKYIIAVGIPKGWCKLGREHLCSQCSEVYERFKDEVLPPQKQNIGFKST